MPEAREHQDAGRQHVEYSVIALEGSGFAVSGPFGLKRDLGDLATIRPAGRDTFRAAWRTAMHEDHVWIFGQNSGRPRADIHDGPEQQTAPSRGRIH